MEKTITITIAEVSFSLSESAYTKLSHYIDSLKARFASDPEGAEIIRDIESRIAEKLLEKKRPIVSERDVLDIQKEIGDLAAFGDAAEELPPSVGAQKKLYRNTSNAMIGGVGSGIAAYFGVEEWKVRLLFLISILFGGTGILLYLALWLVVPEAKTASQRLEMRGDAVTLESIRRVVKERVEETKQSGSLTRTSQMLTRIFSTFFRGLGKVLGAILTIASFLAVIGLTTLLGIVATNWNSPINDFPLRTTLSLPILIGSIGGAYFVALIPLIFIFALGIRLMRKRNVLPSALSFGLVGIWIIAVIALGVTASHIVRAYNEYTLTSPDYQERSQIHSVDAFTRVRIESARVTIRKGPTQEITVTGRALALADIDVAANDGLLTIRERERNRVCIFCFHQTPTVTITAPHIEALEIENGFVTFSDFSGDALSMKSRNGIVRGTINVDDLSFDAQNTNIHASITTRSIIATIRNGLLQLDGTANSAEFTLTNTFIDANDFVITNAVLRTKNATGSVHVTNTLTQPENSSSHITNDGEDVPIPPLPPR